MGKILQHKHTNKQKEEREIGLEEEEE